MSPLFQSLAILAAVLTVGGIVFADAFGSDIASRIGPLRKRRDRRQLRGEFRQIAADLSTIPADEIAALYFSPRER